jgi:hypothetical protein
VVVARRASDRFAVSALIAGDGLLPLIAVTRPLKAVTPSGPRAMLLRMLPPTAVTHPLHRRSACRRLSPAVEIHDVPTAGASDHDVAMAIVVVQYEHHMARYVTPQLDLLDVVVEVLVSAVVSDIHLAVCCIPVTPEPFALQVMFGTPAVAVTGKARSARARMTRRMWHPFVSLAQEAFGVASRTTLPVNSTG